MTQGPREGQERCSAGVDTATTFGFILLRLTFGSVRFLRKIGNDRSAARIEEDVLTPGAEGGLESTGWVNLVLLHPQAVA